VVYPSKKLEEILGRTLGVPLFQEQAMEIAIVAAGFTPAEADGLRRSMATFKSHGQVSAWRTKLVEGMKANGYEETFAERVFKQLEGFGSYGFPESHAASFALLVYISSWIKCYYPDVFATALLNSMPMGFYQPAQIVIDAKKHGVTVLPADVNFSDWDNLLEKGNGKYYDIRLGFRQITGLRAEDMQLLVKHRIKPYQYLHELYDAGVSMAALERLADADAFRSLGLDRRRALWEISALHHRPDGMFKGQVIRDETEQQTVLPEMSLADHVLHDYKSTALSLKAHPVSFARPELFKRGIMSTGELDNWPDGTLVKVSGLVLVKQRPGTASGICFITIEDETGNANLVVFQKKFEQYRKVILQAKLLMVCGKLQKEGEVTHVVVSHCYDMTALLYPASMGNSNKSDKPVQGELFPSRDFK